MTHIPAGIGVLEAVCVALLGSRVSYGELLAAILAFRAVFYLLPLGAAGLMYLVMEAEARADPPRSTSERKTKAPVREASSCASH
jgi:glycosyltransferase 2 family protein